MSVPPGVEALIDGATVSAHVATSVGDRPHVAPVWYEYDDGHLMFTTGGKKLRNIRDNGKIAVSIEQAVGADVDWQVTLLGTATIVDDADRVRAASRRIGAKYADDDSGTGPDPGRRDHDRGEPSDDDAATDGGDAGSVAAEAGRLVIVSVGSTAHSIY